MFRQEDIGLHTARDRVDDYKQNLLNISSRPIIMRPVDSSLRQSFSRLLNDLANFRRPLHSTYPDGHRLCLTDRSCAETRQVNKVN